MNELLDMAQDWLWNGYWLWHLLNRISFVPIITTLIAAVVAYIAVQQYLIARHKLRLDLFDRRIHVFNKVMGIIAVILRDARAPEFFDILQFATETRDAYFLFGPEIPAYIDEVFRQANKLRVIGDVKAQNWPAKQTEIVEWFVAQMEVWQIHASRDVEITPPKAEPPNKSRSRLSMPSFNSTTLPGHWLRSQCTKTYASARILRHREVFLKSPVHRAVHSTLIFLK